MIYLDVAAAAAATSWPWPTHLFIHKFTCQTASHKTSFWLCTRTTLQCISIKLSNTQTFTYKHGHVHLCSCSCVCKMNLYLYLYLLLNLAACCQVPCRLPSIDFLLCFLASPGYASLLAPVSRPRKSNSCLHLIILNLICKQRPGSNNTSLNPNPSCGQVFAPFVPNSHYIPAVIVLDLVPIGSLDGYHIGNRARHAPYEPYGQMPPTLPLPVSHLHAASHSNDLVIAVNDACNDKVNTIYLPSLRKGYIDLDPTFPSPPHPHSPPTPPFSGICAKWQFSLR